MTKKINGKAYSLPLFSLKDAVVALLNFRSLGVDAQRLMEGLPVEHGILTEELLERVGHRFDHEIVWTDVDKVTNLVVPCCLKLRSDEFLVVVDIDTDDLHVLDVVNPTAVRSISLSDVDEGHSGQAFRILPNLTFLLRQHVLSSENKHWFWGRLVLQKHYLFDVITASLFANVLAVTVSLFTLQVYDRVIPGQSEPTLWVLASGVGLAILFEAILRVRRARIIDHIGKEAEIEITSNMFARLLGVKLDNLPSSPGAVVNMIREFSSVKEFFSNVAIGLISDLPFSFIFLLLIYGIAGPIVWIIMLGAVLIALPNILLQRRMARLSDETMGGLTSASKILIEASYSLEAIKISRSESLFQRQWEEVIALNALKTTEQRTLRALLTYWATSIQQATYVCAVIACVYLIFAGELSGGVLIAVAILTTRTLSPISQLSNSLLIWQNMKSALAALETLMLAKQERSLECVYVSKPRVHGDISVKNLRYSHSEVRGMAIDIGNLEIKAGMRIALLGSNGSGKSTLLRLIAGLYQPADGEVEIDGLNLRQIDPSDLRRNIGLLPQEIKMFRGSLRENLSPTTHKSTDEELHQALTFGGLGKFVKQSPEGLDLRIGDGGDGLSIGQKQSIGLARIYLQDPSIILLDEPTSSLDEHLEKAVVKRIGSWIGSRTCIIATHRQEILSEMSHIAVLKQGQVVLQGKRDATRKNSISSSMPLQTTESS